MAVDEDLAKRVRAVLAGSGEPREVRMFGGLCFMLNGNMVAGASKRGLLVRVGNEQHARSVARPDARPMEMSGRTMEGYVVIDPPPKEDRVLREWIELAVAFVQTLPAKPPKLSARRSTAKECQVQNATIVSNKMPGPPKPHSTKAAMDSRKAAVAAIQSSRWGVSGVRFTPLFGDRQPWHRTLADPPVQRADLGR
jgi:hypothetical protein